METIIGRRLARKSGGVSRFEDLRRRDAAHKANLYAFDLIKHDGEDVRGGFLGGCRRSFGA